MIESKKEEIIKLFKHRLVLRPRDIEEFGISGEYLNKLSKQGVLDRPCRGLYTLKRSEIDPCQALLEASKQAPNSIACLLSTLQFHELTTQLPFQVWLMIDVKAHSAKIDYPSVRFLRASGLGLSYGVEEQQINNTVKIYNPAKTVADCFKYRSKIGLDVAIEALRGTWLI